MTNCVIYPASGIRHPRRVLNTDTLLARLEERGIRNVDIARVLDLPESRITEIRKKARTVKLDEAAKLVEAFELESPRKVSPLHPAILRLLAGHIASELGLPLEPDDPRLTELLADLQAFARFVSDPQVRESISASESFFRAMRLRRESAPTDRK